MQKNKSIKKILQTTAIIATILPLNLLYLTSQTVYTEKDATVFNLDNFDVASRKLLPVGTIFTLADAPKDEQQKWCSSFEGPPLRFEVIPGTEGNRSPHGEVKILNNISSDKTIINDLEIQSFITGPDGLVYDIRKIGQAAFSPNTSHGGNTILRFPTPRSDTFRIPSGVEELGDYMLTDYNRQQQFPCSGKFAFSFYVGNKYANFTGKLFGSLNQSIIPEELFSEVFFTNSSSDKNVCLQKPIISPAPTPSAARLTDAHLNGYMTTDIKTSGPPEDSGDPFFSCSKIKNVFLFNPGSPFPGAYYGAPSYGTNPFYNFESSEIMESQKNNYWATEYPDAKCQVGTPSIKKVVAELPPDINVVYNSDDPSTTGKSLNFASYVEGDYFDNDTSQTSMTAKFYFNGEAEENLNFTFEKTSQTTIYDQQYSKNHHIFAQPGLDPDKKKYFDGIYPCKMILSSTYDPMIKEEYMFNVEIKGNPRPSATSVSLNQKTMDIPFTEKRTLTASVLPAEADQTLDWKSSNPAIVSVDSKGELTANGIGNATITATSHLTPSLSDTCAVTIKYATPINIELSSETISTNVITPQEITYLVNPSPSANQAIEISSNNPEIATATKQGNKITITPHSIGVTEIWITSEAKSDVRKKCIVTITGVTPTGITLDHTSIIGQTGASRQLKAKIEPWPTADQTDVEWSSSSPAKASVDQLSGLVIFVANSGSCTITAKVKSFPNLTANCEVTIIDIPQESVQLDKTTYSGKVNDTFKISATINPVGVDQSVLWESDNKKVATVDKDGNVTLISAGNATILARSEVDLNLTATCVVTSTDNGISSVMIAGITLGTVLGVTLIASGTTIYLKKPKKNKKLSKK